MTAFIWGLAIIRGNTVALFKILENYLQNIFIIRFLTKLKAIGCSFNKNALVYKNI